jgi:hypothetical protein
MSDDKVWEYKSNENDPLAEKVKKDRTIVMTKPTMAKYLMERLNIADNDIVIEPCKGDGAFYDNFPDNCIKKYCEINEGKDFLLYDEKVDYCCGNPPFVPRKLFWSFHEKAMEITQKEIYWLINLSSLNVFTPKRLEEMREKGWYIQDFHIVSDKRWIGRYVWIKINKNKNSVFSWNKKTF